MSELTTPLNFATRNTMSDSRRGTLPAPWLGMVVFALICLTRIVGLTHQSLWYDEGYTFNLASSPNFSAFLKTFAGYTTSEHLQPVYYFFMFLWSRLAGTSDIALRLPSALFSAASCFAIFDLSLRLPRIGRLSFALPGCAAIAASSFSVYYAQEARPYALLQALSLWLINLWIRRKYLSPSADPTKASGAAFALLCGLCALGSAFTALLVFALALTDWLVDRSKADRSKSAWLRSWGTSLSFSALCALAYLGFGIHAFPGFVARDVTSIKQPLWMNVGYTIYGVLFGTTLGPSNAALRGNYKLHLLLSFWPLLLASAMAATMLAIGITYVLWAGVNIPAATRPIALATAIYAVAFFSFFGLVGHLNILPRHASALFSLLFTLTLLCATGLEVPNRPKTFAWLYLGISTWLAMNLVSLYGYRFNPGFQKDDYRSATELISSSESTSVFMIAGQPRLIQHYGASVIDASYVPPQELAGFLRERSHNTPEVWLVMNEYRGFRWDHSPSPADVLAPDYACLLERHVAFMDVFACRLKLPVLLSGESYPSYVAPANGVYVR